MPNRFPWTWPNPFRKDTPERRSGGEYERLLTQALHDAASGSADSAMPGSVATAAGFIARGFAAAEPSGIGAVLYPPSVRSRIAWDLAAYGDSLWQLRNGRLQLVRSYTIRGGTYYHSGVALQDTVHFRVFTGNDGRGYGTLQAGANLYKTAADLERSLRYEARAPTGHILPVGGQMDSKVVANLTTLLASISGQTVVLMSGHSGYGQGGGQGRSQPRLQSTRIGPTYPADVVSAHDRVCESILAALGVPPEMLARSQSAGVIRDAWRQLSYGCLTPLALLIEESSPLTVSFDFSRLMTGDSAGASRAFRSLVEAGLTIEEAADNTGIRLDSAIPPEQRAEPLLRLDTDRYVNNS